MNTPTAPQQPLSHDKEECLRTQILHDVLRLQLALLPNSEHTEKSENFFSNADGLHNSYIIN